MDQRIAGRRLGGPGTVRAAALMAAGLVCLPAAAQDGTVTPRYNGAGYAVFGIGACQHRYANTSFAGGGHFFVWKGLSLGGEIGYYRFVERNARGFGIATLDVGYHFVNRKQPLRLDPFVSGGVLGVGFARGGIAAAGGLGGGVTYWFKPHLGMRAEGRVQGFAEEAIAMFRIGLAFR